MLFRSADPEYLGRVFGVMGMIGSGVMPLAMLLFGPLADVISIEWLLIVTGVLQVVLALGLSRNKSLVRAGEQLAPPAAPDLAGGCAAGQPECTD